MENKFLPIGSIVLLKGAKKKIMITGFLCKDVDNNSELFDYLGCPYPEGLIAFNQNVLFNNDQIEQVFKEGYKDNEEIEYKEKLNKLIEDIKNSGE